MAEVTDRRATLSSVAHRAAVSRQTVSNVVNAPHLVRPETRERVEAVIDELNYRPHRGARSLRTRRSQLIGVRLDPFRDGVNGFVLDRFLHALTETSAARGYRVLLFSAADDRAEISTYDELIDTHDIDGFVLTSTHPGDERTAWLAERRVPFVTFGRPWSDARTHSWVDVDGQAGVHEVTRRLVAAGHERIAFIGWPEGSGVGDDRCAGWTRAMAEAGLDVTGLRRQTADDSMAQGRSAATELATGAGAPTAYVCVSDSIAAGAMGAVAELGRPAGPDHPVIGFDDTPVAAALGLSSCAQPLPAVAAQCVQVLNQLMRAPSESPLGPTHVLLEPHVVVRATGGQ